MTATRIIGWVVTLGMAAAIIYGFSTGSFGDEFSTVWALPWGKVSLIDLYLGFLIFGAWIGYRESSRARIGLWWVALAVLGNFAAGVYLVRATFTARDVPELLLGDRSAG